jgi:hypothetical protein
MGLRRSSPAGVPSRTNTSQTGRPSASPAAQPVMRSATAFMRVTRPSPSVVRKPASMADSVAARPWVVSSRSSSALCRRSTSRRSASLAMRISSTDGTASSRGISRQATAAVSTEAQAVKTLPAVCSS